jgi:hypothetical protein
VWGRCLSPCFVSHFIQIFISPFSMLELCGLSSRLTTEIVGSNPTGSVDVCCECRVLSGRGLYNELITRPEEF